MLKTVTQLLVSGYLWRQYKNKLKPFLLFVSGLLVIFLLHSEYLSYTQVTGNTDYVGISFLLKWLVIIAITLAYILLPLRAASTQHRRADVDANGEMAEPAAAPDPFANIRKKKLLKGKGDFILEDKQ